MLHSQVASLSPSSLVHTLDGNGRGGGMERERGEGREGGRDGEGERKGVTEVSEKEVERGREREMKGEVERGRKEGKVVKKERQKEREGRKTGTGYIALPNMVNYARQKCL